MALTINLRKKVHRKIVEPVLTTAPAATTNGTFISKDKFNLGDGNQCYYVAGAALIYQWFASEEGWGLLPVSGIAGTFGSGACGYVHPSGPTGTATAGTTTTITTALTLNRDLRGYRVRITKGTAAGQERIITSNTLGANSVITVQDAFGAAIDSTSVFLLLTGRLWMMFPAATPGLGYYDFATHTWTVGRSVTGLTFLGTDGYLEGTPGIECPTDQGTATGSQTTTTLQDTSRSWSANIWANQAVYIVSGTGVGQYRVISSNTPNTLTVTSAWGVTPDSTSVYQIMGFYASAATAGSATTVSVGGTPWTASQWVGCQVRIISGTGVGQVAPITANSSSALTVASWANATPDATSVFVIEGNDDTLWCAGNAAVALFKYSISGNSWATAAATAARAAVTGSGLSLSYIASVNDPQWKLPTGIPNSTTYRQNGRFLYSFRGNNTGILDVYDIALGTWYSGVAYGGASNEVFGGGTSWDDVDGYLYCQKDSTGRVFRFDCAKNELINIIQIGLAQGSACNGAKVWLDKYFDPANGKSLRFVYCILNTSAQIARLLEI